MPAASIASLPAGFDVREQPHGDDKPSYTLFTDEAMALLDQHGWTELLLCGIATESCVLKTAIDAFERGLTPWLLTDACASHAGRAATMRGYWSRAATSAEDN